MVGNKSDETGLDGNFWRKMSQRYQAQNATASVDALSGYDCNGPIGCQKRSGGEHFFENAMLHNLCVCCRRPYPAYNEFK
ncbi:uncharacterized protein ARMOST_19574 [Armillaria ostoyae]|uniref:Uncharacterized protein n=1 Tax=Armillaria ostoyae TaxID=47428 RepID=A0A284S4X8_ARMOS|nr:uncharacterized protein ARMOST_19574 [Armillaria ostoyae]